MTDRPLRSLLYIPASNDRALEKVRSLACDGIIFDLEDAVAPDRKDEARTTLAATLAATDYAHRLRIVRVNAPDTPWGAADMEATRGMEIDAILLPKVGEVADLDIQTEHPIWVMLETPRAILNAAALAAHPRVAGLVMGTNDLARALRVPDAAGRGALLTSLSLAVLAARAAGKPVIDGVFTQFKDLGGLRTESEQGRDLGFDGKSLIHPVQIDVANEVFGPTAGDVERARAEIEAFEAAAASGRGVAVLDGRIVENLHAAAARDTLARAEAIARLT
ncbi:HpcH/HpaI aldolase/citrate lyase family protein [Falsirhodobacter halotolerans]|uniref:HpcH/HpaI aldolase/citrate lyase family protein n=1 Tax=Falsirhodobacter halotolerans TaxID=1146892 RepID=UPI001FD0FD1D|nr:CoA ester lyase [Falsirhodobacter halotolerans]MCJ8140442.1 CoA ester lyase [Falsirhodobacter halotolerans]